MARLTGERDRALSLLAIMHGEEGQGDVTPAVASATLARMLVAARAEASNAAWLAAIGVIADLRNQYQPGQTFSVMNHAVWALDEARRVAILAAADALSTRGDDGKGEKG